MRAHVFVDETKERCYLVAAVAVRPSAVTTTRHAIKGLILPRQRRLHFESESIPRRDKILGVISGLGVSAVIYDGSRYRRERDARAACLKRLVVDLVQMRAERLILETDDAAVQADRKLLFQEIRRAGVADDLRYDHMRSYEECLLAIPDAIAWCWRRGGLWREKIATMVTSVHEV